MIHSARTNFNVAMAPVTAKLGIAPLHAARDAIEASLNGGDKLKPADLDAIGASLSQVLFAGPVRQLYDTAATVADRDTVGFAACKTSV